MKSQTYTIAAFPLNVIVLPGEEIMLKIFESSYKQLVNECIRHKLTFGIPYLHQGLITGVGSEVEITSVVGGIHRQDMLIKVKGKSLFNTLDFFPELPNKLYGGAIAEVMTNDFETQNPEIAVKVKMLKLNITPKLGTLIVDQSMNMLDIAKVLALKSEDKFRLITARSKAAKEQFLIRQLHFIEAIRLQEVQLDNNFLLN